MQPQHSSEEYSEIAEKVRSGEYFREARRMYDIAIHDPMADRYLYVLIAILSVLTLILAIMGMESIYPLSRQTPFIVNSHDIVDDLPHIKPLIQHKGETPNPAMMRFLVSNYIALRESYDIDTFDDNINGIKSQSAEAVFGAFQQSIDPRNPDSPITLYQRHSKRLVSEITLKPARDSSMEATFISTINTGGELKKSLWQANISFQFSGVGLDEKTGKFIPLSFVVTQYRSNPLQDIK